MRDFKGMKRQRGRNRKPGGGGGNANAANPNRSWDSQGPENIKVRGNAQTVYERYQQLARDAGSSGDRVLAENYLQHAEHYFRVLRALQPQRPVSEIAARELSNQGYDIDFEDETGAQAAAFLAAQQAADRIQQQSDARDAEAAQGSQQPREPREWTPRPPRDNPGRDGQDRDQNQNREWTPRPPRETRDTQDGGQPRAEGEQGEGGRRETRRERWERRREERNRRYEAEGGTPDTRSYEEAEGHRSDNGRDNGRDNGDRTESVRESGSDAIASTAPIAYVPPTEPTPVAAERPARRTRTPRAEADTDTAGALPGFLTRPSAPAPAAADEAAPKRRAPRKKPEGPADTE
ncbi:DUF4167 domain-containing protein [Brevundimonas sp. AJA228-03]|uniref:DUF4167 domain-containing protein n=1 Tax=Brevundimonas sp. AJA228-03 TaxID=2752515 RepID=UPI001AE0CE7C|nr:DUF4167 domain-containing protein [Brevundimonas sp. AJA228-03]QTN20078.1 DUF4167 domain-containing protein [Brevundimonas sp. AJA228-03]